MPIPITCSHCDSDHEAPDFLAGKEIPCPQCQKIIQIPFQSESDSSFSSPPLPEQPLADQGGLSSDPLNNRADDESTTFDRPFAGGQENKPRHDLAPDLEVSRTHSVITPFLPPVPTLEEVTREVEIKDERTSLTLPLVIGGLLALVLLAVLIFFLFLNPAERGFPLVENGAGTPKDLQRGNEKGGGRGEDATGKATPELLANQPDVIPVENQPLDGTDVLRATPPTSAAEDLTRAIKLFQEKDFDGVRELITSAIAKDPGNPQLYYWLGKTLAEKDDPLSALPHLDTAIGLDSQNHLYYALRARLILLQQPGAAHDDLIKAIQINPHFAEAFFLQGQVLDELGKPSDAIKAYDRAIDLDRHYTDPIIHRSIDYFLLGENNLALSDINLALTLGASTSILYSIRAQILFNGNDYATAIDNFDKALELDPDDSLALVFRAIAKYHERQPVHEIQSDLDRAIEIDQDFPTAYYWRARVRFESGNSAGALEDIEQAFRITQHKHEYYKLRALIYIDEKKLGLALEDFNQAIELFPTDAGYYLNRGRVQFRFASQYDEIPRRRYALALEDFSRSVQLMPEMTNEAWQLRANMLSRLGSEADPKLASQLCREGKREYEADRPWKALELFQLARDKDPGYLWAHNNLACLCATNDMVQDPKLAMDAVLDLARRTSGTRHHRFLGTLAVVFAANQQWDGAVLYARKAASNSPPAMEEFYKTLLQSVQRKEPFQPARERFSLIQ